MKTTKKFQTLIHALQEEVGQKNQVFSRVKPAQSSKKLQYQKHLNKISQLRGRPLYYPYISSGLGQGPFVQLLDGSVKLDFICGIGSLILGHGHPEMVRASLLGALQDAPMQGHFQVNAIYEKVLDKLLSLAQKGSSLSQGWLCPSGSMANENALKIIRQKHQGARYILAFEHAFAGRTTMMTEITDNPTVKEGLPSYGEVLRIPFCPSDKNKALKVLKKHWQNKGKQLACLMVELMQGDGGYRRAPREFFVPLFEFCQKKGLAIWIDEVQTFARTGEFFAFQKLNLESFVDVCTVGKALQMGASLWTKKYQPRPGLVSGTFAGSTTSFYCALALLDFLDKQGYMGSRGRIHQINNQWTERLKILEDQELLKDIEGWGLMTGVTPFAHRDQEVKTLLQILFENGLICFSCGSSKHKRLRFLLPAIIQEEHLDQGFDILKKSLKQLKNKRKR